MTENPKDEWMLTHCGLVFHYGWTSNTKIEDIAHALSMLCRWNGHVEQFYSVGDHSLRVCAEVIARTRDLPNAERRHLALWALLHDAAEAYVGDRPSPLKRYLTALGDVQFGILEGEIQNRAALKFGLTGTEPGIVTAVDMALAATEWRDLMPSSEQEWPPGMPLPLAETIVPRGMKEVEQLFITAFDDIRQGRFTTEAQPQGELQ
jgi:5'-nucleotidase